MKKQYILSLLMYRLLVFVTLLTSCNTDQKSVQSIESNTPQDTNPIENHEHIWSAWMTEKEATCTTKGLKSRTCECGEKDEITFATLEHNFGEWIIVNAAKCTESGLQERACSMCGLKETEVIDALSHIEGEEVILNGAKCFPCIYCQEILRTEQLQTSEGLCINNGIITSIGDCSSTEIVIPLEYDDYTITIIGSYAFEYTKINSIILHDSIDIIEENAFYQCFNLESVKFGSNILYIGEMAFYKCTALKSIHLPVSLKVLSERAFAYCSKLESIYMENNLNKIEMRAFQDCTSLKDIYFNGTIEEWISIEKGLEWDLGTPEYTVHCTNGDIEK